MIARTTLITAVIALTLPAIAGDVDIETLNEKTQIQCGNLVYSKGQTSVCFSNHFLTRVAKETNLNVSSKYKKVNLTKDEVFDTPFCIFTGEGKFSLSESGRTNLQKYLTRGGFVLASPGCSDADWNKAFRREIANALPNHKLVKIPMSHEMFSTVRKISRLTCKGRTVLLEGIEIDGRIALVYSPEGLNNARNAKGCCCCGGAEISEAVETNINIFTYALLY